jgi:two-component system OmpR family sensor kinase
LNRDEKRALTGFLAIYILSALVLMGIIAFLYYQKAVDEAERNCKNDLKSTLLMAEMDLRKACMQGTPYRFDPNRYKLHVGLFDKEYRPIASSLHYTDINFSSPLTIHKAYIQMQKRVDAPVLGVRYIVAEDIRMPSQLHNLKLLIAVTMLVSMLFVAFVGYLLSRLLLAPARERIKTLNRFIKDATHEINTPVTALLMSVSALKKKGVLEEKLLRHISISSKQIANIYNSLSHISFDAHKTTEIKRFDLKKAIQKNIAFFDEIARSKQIGIVSELTSTYVSMDREDVDKLIGNLLSNAIKYSPPNTTITLSLKEAVFRIKDQGIGISQSDQQKIFKRYTRASELGGGFGIGLDIVNSIARKYGIEITIDSQEGTGTTFILDFSKIAH